MVFDFVTFLLDFVTFLFNLVISLVTFNFDLVTFPSPNRDDKFLCLVIIHKRGIYIFIKCMAKLHREHLQQDIDQFLKSTSEEMADKTAIQQEMANKWS